jgi:putative transposase
MAIDLKLIDELLVDYKKPEDITGEHGLLKQLTKASWSVPCRRR